MKKILIPTLTVAILFSGCLTYNYSKRHPEKPNDNSDVGPSFYIPMSKKKAKRTVYPSDRFVAAIKQYRFEKGFFPNDLALFEHYNEKSREGIKNMKERGFEDLQIEYLYMDSLVLKFAYRPALPERKNEVRLEKLFPGKLIFTTKDSTFNTITMLD
jgi:hypothetical protein